MAYRIKSKGSRVDRNIVVNFTFDGKKYRGFLGDTLASALLANDVWLTGRSFKYHRARGVMAIGSAEPNALVTVGEKHRKTPNLRASEIEIYDSLSAYSQNRWPSLRFDLGALINLAAPIFPAGFYYKTFLWPRRAWYKLYEPIIRKMAGLGKLDKSGDQGQCEHIHSFCDILIVGGGVCGLEAARIAASQGAKILLMDENPVMGGLSLLDADQKIDTLPVAQWVQKTSKQLRALANVTMLSRTTVAGHFAHNYVLACQNLGDYSTSASPVLRHRLWKIRAKQIILAAGAVERPLCFACNDRPGVMLASAMRDMLENYGVMAGKNIVLFTNNDDAYRTALALHACDGEVTIVDLRAENDTTEGALVQAARKANIKIYFAHAIVALKGKKQVKSVVIAPIRSSGLIGDPLVHIVCEGLAMSGGWNPSAHLACHSGGHLRYVEEIAAMAPEKTPPCFTVCGAAKGIFSLAEILPDAHATVRSVIKQLTGGKNITKLAKAGRAQSVQEAPIKPVSFVPGLAPYESGDKHFVDFQNDVTLFDLSLAAREGFQSVEHVKRYTTLGMATDQGKTSNVTGLAVLSDILGTKMQHAHPTVFRPPYTPLSFGAIIGVNRGDIVKPLRLTPISRWANAHGAHNKAVGYWRRPECYLREGENYEQAVHREVLCVRHQAACIDASTLGKIEIQGADAAKFLDRIYCNHIAKMKTGACRYGLMLNDHGYIIDDGVVARLAQNRFLLHTTSAHAGYIYQWLEEWLQTEWSDLQVYITDVSEQWAQITLAGPNARMILEQMDSDIHWEAEEFAFMQWRSGRLAGVPVRVFRISFTGELSFEIATPAGYGLHIWQSLLAADPDLAPFGVEAMEIMRAEKGYIVVGDETDGLVTPADLGFGRLIGQAKGDFIGKRSLEAGELNRPDRRQLVGVKTEEPDYVLPVGAHCVEEVKHRPPMQMTGRITSSYFSPTLERSIALGMIRGGRKRIGEQVFFPLSDGVRVAEIVKPVFYDPDRERQNV